MKEIVIRFALTGGEYELLRLGKCDKPSPQRIKMQLLQEAARNLRNMSESVLQGARGERPIPVPKPARGRDDRAEKKNAELRANTARHRKLLEEKGVLRPRKAGKPVPYEDQRYEGSKQSPVAPHKLPSFHWVPGKYVNSKAELREINKLRARGEDVRPVTLAEQRAAHMTLRDPRKALNSNDKVN